MKKIFCFISMFAIMACAFSQNYYNNGTTTARNREQKEQKGQKTKRGNFLFSSLYTKYN